MSINKIRLATAITISAVALGTATPSGASPTFNKNAYCAAGNAVVALAPKTKGVTIAYLVNFMKLTATDYGRVSSTAPNTTVTNNFAALHNDMLAYLGDKKAIDSLNVSTPSKNQKQTHPYSDKITMQLQNELPIAYASAAKTATEFCGPKSPFSNATNNAAHYLSILHKNK